MSHTRLRVGAALLLAGLLAVPACTARRPTEIVRRSADQLRDAGDYEAAATEYQEVARRYPGDWRAQHELGLCWLELERYGDARRALTIALERRPHDDRIAGALAEAMYHQGDETHLFAFLRQRAASDQTVEAHLRLARYAIELGDADSAKVALDTAIQIDGGRSVDPYIDAASFAQRIGDLELAIRRLRQAYGIDPRDARVSEQLIALGEIPGPTIALPPGR